MTVRGAHPSDRELAHALAVNVGAYGAAPLGMACNGRTQRPALPVYNNTQERAHEESQVRYRPGGR